MKKSMPRYHRYISIIGLGGVEVKGRMRLWSGCKDTFGQRKSSFLTQGGRAMTHVMCHLTNSSRFVEGGGGKRDELPGRSARPGTQPRRSSRLTHVSVLTPLFEEKDVFVCPRGVKRTH